jgi:methionyl aminopeptidase
VSAVRVESFRLKRPEEIEQMRAAGRILGECLEHLAATVRPGLTARDLDREADTFIRDHGCVPGFLGYQGFPNSLCVSINEEVVHGIPGQRVIEEGDLVALDCGLILDGWWADSGLSVACGDASPEVARLIDVTREALERGIAAAQPGNRIGDIGHAVQSYVESHSCSIVRDYGGHGIGRNMHEPPHVPNHGEAGTGNVLKPGYVLAIEPIVNEGSPKVRLLDDGWTVVTADGKRSAYFEHTVAVTEAGPQVLTRRPGSARQLTASPGQPAEAIL